MSMGRWGRLVLGASACALALAFAAGHPNGQPQRESPFASRIEQFSEPGGYFDTDNLISNEGSYLHVIDALRQQGVSGGVYIGVGPDQNFSYIAQIRPSIAFIVDVRRDNLLLHLLFKALFELSTDRADYLSLMFARPPPGDRLGEGRQGWRDADVGALAAYVDGTMTHDALTIGIRARVDRTIERFGVPLTRDDLETIDRFHRRFIRAGLSLKFQSTGRAPLSYYPTYRDLLLETDRGGRQRSYLADDASFQFVKSLQESDAVVPLVGNLAGDRALASIADFMDDRGDRLSAFYTSNVELYLSQDGLLEPFLANLARLPHDHRSVIIRSVFRTATPETVPGYYSTSLVRPVAELVADYDRGRVRGYWDLIDR